ATTSACSPEAIASHAPACACVGASNAPSNHARVGAEKGASGSAEAPVDVIDPFSPAAPTRRVRYHPRRPRPPPGYTNHDGVGTRTPCPQGGTTMHEHELFDAEATAVPSELQGLTDALATAEDKFLDKPNVVGVALGHKITDGVMSDTPSIMVLVSHKVPADMLRPADRVTKTVDNTPTDVLEVGHLVAGGEAPAEPLRAVDAQTLASRVRPVRPGYSMGHPKVTAGTIGAGCYDIAPLPGMPPRYYVLSNNHVLANSNDAQIGDPVYQPGVFDGGGPADAIGRLARYVPIRFDGTCNYVDAAIAEVPFDTIDRDIYWSGYPTTAATAAPVGQLVKKTGRTTHFTTGRVTAVNATVNVGYGGGKVARFCNQIITTTMSAGGDSGSLVLDWENRPVGLLFAGSAVATILNPIATVQVALGVRLWQ